MVELIYKFKLNVYWSIWYFIIVVIDKLFYINLLIFKIVNCIILLIFEVYRY